jgi:hypothetical protein
VLPGTPALAVLASLWLARLPQREQVSRSLATGVATMALLSGGATVLAINIGGWGGKSSTRSLVADFECHRGDGEVLIFFPQRPASAAFYSEGRAVQVCHADELGTLLDPGSAFVTIKVAAVDQLPEQLRHPLQRVSRRGRYELFRSGPDPLAAGERPGT